MTTTSYTVFRVPKTGDVALAQQYRQLRLQALQTSPASFSSTYEREATFTEEDWVKLLYQEGFERFVCQATWTTADGTQSTAWVGQVTLRGPTNRAAFSLSAESGSSASKPDDEEEKWQILSLYNDPEHRGQGLAKRIVSEALHYLQERPLPFVLVRLMVKPTNTAVINLWETLGFTLDGKCTLEEAMRSNGDAGLVPADAASDSKYQTRSGLIMVRRLTRP